MDECSIRGCVKPLKTRGWCQMHYMRWYTTGEVGPPESLRPTRGMPESERFWLSVDKTAECWEWTGTRSKAGYGQFPLSSSPKQVRAHRFAYENLVAPIPDGLTIDHLCRNRGCVNPSHLEPVTLAENVRRSSIFRRKNPTACPHGHPYPENALLRANGSIKDCRACNRRRAREFYHRTRGN